MSQMTVSQMSLTRDDRARPSTGSNWLAEQALNWCGAARRPRAARRCSCENPFFLGVGRGGPGRDEIGHTRGPHDPGDSHLTKSCLGFTGLRSPGKSHSHETATRVVRRSLNRAPRYSQATR